MADKNKVRYGISNLHVAFVTSKDAVTGVPAYDDPIAVPGAVSFNAEEQVEESVFYADNIRYFVTLSNTGTNIELEVAKFPDEVLAEMLGNIIDAIGGLINVTDGVKKQFALMGQMQGDISARRFCYFICNGAAPSADRATAEDTIEPTTETMTIVTQPTQLAADGPLILSYALPLDDAIPGCVTAYNAFFDAVYLPIIPTSA